MASEGTVPADQVAGSPETLAVHAALAKSGYRFTPEVKAVWIAVRKKQALAEIARAGCALPDDFLAWVDSDPAVATTVYGLATPGSSPTGKFVEKKGRQEPVMGPDAPSQRLVFLRSLEMDLGVEEVRRKHTQMALAFTHFNAGCVDKASMSNDARKVSLKPRGLIKLEIPTDPRVRIDTRAKDRTLDINDHIINFMEDHPVVTEKKVVKEENGKKIEAIETQSRPRHAHEVYSDPEMVGKFNAYMTGHGFPMNLDSTNCKVVPAHWGGGKDVIKAYRIFLTAYMEKGLLPKAGDPRPLPVELAAYLIRNDNHRFPDGVKRGWPRFNLNAPWPILQWLVTGGESLREREFVWERFRDTGSVVGYGSYIGQIAQYPEYVKARKLQPFAFSYNTYPMRLKDGGVCGTCSNIGRFSNIALGVPANQASQPGHSCFVAIGGNEERGFGMSVGQSVGNPTYVSGYGRLEHAIAGMVLPVNFGLMPLLDSRIAMQLAETLPAATPAKDKQALLVSAFETNPYNLEAVTTILNARTNPRQLVEFWQTFNDTLGKIVKPGCPANGSYNNFVVKSVFDTRLTKLPIPADKADVEFIASSLADRSDALWLNYHIAAASLPALKEKMAADLNAAVAGQRSPQSCALLSARLVQVGGAIKDVAEKKAWANQLIAIIGDKHMYTAGEGKKAREYADPCAATALTLAGNSPDARMEFEKSLQAAVNGVRTPAGCDLMVNRLNAIAKDFKNAKERKVWADTLLAIINGHESFAPASAPHKPMLDPLVNAIYALGPDLSPAKTRLEADLMASVAGTRTAATTAVLNQRLALIAKYIRDAKAIKAWMESALLPLVAGKEYFPVALPKNQGTKETADPCATFIHRTLGTKFPTKQ